MDEGNCAETYKARNHGCDEYSSCMTEAISQLILASAWQVLSKKSNIDGNKNSELYQVVRQSDETNWVARASGCFECFQGVSLHLDVLVTRSVPSEYQFQQKGTVRSDKNVPVNN